MDSFKDWWYNCLVSVFSYAGKNRASLGPHGRIYDNGALAGGSTPRTPQKVGCLPAASRAHRALGPPRALWALEAAGRQPTFWGVRGAEPQGPLGALGP